MVHVIGISGPSCSGKSTIATKLKELFPNLTIIHSDDYFKHYKEFPKFNEKWRHTEIPENIKDDELYKKLKKELTKNKIIIIEGYLLYHFKNIVDLINTKIFIEVSNKNLFCRRINRGGHFSEPDFVKEVVIPSYNKHKKLFKKISDYKINGDQNLEKVIKEIFAIVDPIIKKELS